MNLFVILITYTSSLDEINEILPTHREYLKKHYESGILLASGPREPKVGGIVIGKFQSKDDVLEFISKDPYNLAKVASYEILEFNAVLHSSILDDFLG